MRCPYRSLLLLSLLGCSSAAAPKAAQTPVPSGTAPAAAPVAGAPTTAPRELTALNAELQAERVSGTIALYDTQEGVLGCSDVKRCSTPVTPASTFKIPHSMIALEAGVVEGPDTVMPWDHQQYSNESWNQDLTFREAFRVSCVPCYKAIARKLGEAQEQAWLDKLSYGNRDSSGGVDRFWLWGGLRISALEQLDFLRRFEAGKLPISRRTADIVSDLMTLDVTEQYVLRGKTGSASPPDQPQETYWFVGWLELGERRVFFATLLDGHAPDVDPLTARRRVTERVLRAKGYM